jgi:hypothetical protein
VTASAAPGAAGIDPRLARTGAWAAFGLAAATLASAACAGLMPPELQGRPEITAHEFWTVLSRDPTAHLAFHAAFVVAGLCGLAAVPALSAAAWRAHPGAVLWSGAAAWLGFAVLARSHLMELAFDRKIIPAYASASPAFQEAVHVAAGLALDVPDGVLTHGAVGVWMAVLGVLAFRHGTASRGFAALSLAAGATQLAGVVGYALLLRPLLVVAIGLGGGLLLPAWFVLAGIRLRREAS